MLHLKKLFFITCVLFVIVLSAQANPSNNKETATPILIDPAYIDSLNKVAFATFRNNPNETRQIALKSLSLSKSINYPTGEGKANNYIAMTYHLAGDFDTSYVYYQKALEIFKTDNDTANIGKIYNNLALLFTHREYYHLALDYNLKSLEYAKLLNNPKEKFHSYNNIGITYEKLGEYDKAIEAYQHGLDAIVHKTGLEELKYYAKSNLGIINLLTHQYDKAEDQLKQGLNYYLGANDNYGISQSYRYLGELYIVTKKFIQAKEALEKSSNYANIIEDKKLKVETQFLLARLLYEENKLTKARDLFSKSLDIAQKEDYLNIKRECFSFISKIDSLNGNYYDALINYQASTRLKDSINSQKIQNQIAQFSIQYQTLQKEQKIEKLLRNEEMQALIIHKHLTQRKFFFIILIFIFILLTYGFITQIKIRKKNELLTNQNDEIDNKNEELLQHRNHLEKLVKQRTAELIKAKDSAKESDHLKSVFLANMSHEIRTPMNGILGFTSLLQKSNLSGETREQYIEIIKKSGDRMLNTLNDLISISMIETGQEKLNYKEIDPCKLIEDIFDFFKTSAENKGLEFRFDHLCTQQHDLIQFDASKLSSIVNNLIRNAIKFTDKGSIVISSYKDSKTFTLSVKDTGQGIAKDRQEAIFDRFIQADIEDKMALQGSGLGLSIVKAYVDMMDGTIHLESEPGKGSCFTVELPIIKIDSNDKKSVKTPPDKTKIELNKILIAEDDDISYQHLSICLEPYVHNILHAVNGEEAVQMAKEHHDLDLILMDIKMPKLDGYEATKKIRAFNKNIPIICQTAYALHGDKEKSLDAGCNGHVSKPINIEELLLVIAENIKHKT